MLVLGGFALVLASGFAALGFLVTGLYIWLASDLPPGAAAVVTGAVLLAICGVLLLVLVRLVGRAGRSSPAGSPEARDGPRASTDLVDIVVREAARNPATAVFAALSAGVVYGLTNRARDL